MTSPAPAGEGLPLLRLSGGITYQPLYTFRDRMRQIADDLRTGLLGQTHTPHWPGKGFQVKLPKDMEQVTVTHLQQSSWFVNIGERDIFYQYDQPDVAGLRSIFEVQAYLLNEVCTKLGVKVISSIGTKYIALLPMNPRHLSVERFLNISPEPLLSGPESRINEFSFRLGYRFGIGGASLQVVIDTDQQLSVLDLDCYCVDVFALGGNYLQFMLDSLEHFQTVVPRFMEQVGNTAGDATG